MFRDLSIDGRIILKQLLHEDLVCELDFIVADRIKWQDFVNTVVDLHGAWKA
jgi:hypothetical protein